SDGTLVLCDPALNGLSSSSGGIALVDPLTGSASAPYAFQASPAFQDAVCYDSFRDRIVFSAQLTPNDPFELLAGDALGNSQPLGVQGVNCGAFAPTGDGRIYFRASNEPTPAIRILDVTDTVGFLLNQSGQPFTVPNNNAWGHLEYHAGTNSLILASRGFAAACGPLSAITVRRYDLSPDGSTVVGETCVSFDVEPGGTQTVVGLTPIDANDFLITVDNNSSQVIPRLLRLNAATLTFSVFASPDYFGAASTSAGAWSDARGQAVVYDTFNDTLRAFSKGQSGEGTLLAPFGSFGTSGGTGQIATLIEIDGGSPADTLVALDTTTLSATAGGTQTLQVQVGPGFAGDFYFVLGSLSGTAPGLPINGQLLPLNFDAYFNYTLQFPNTPPLANSLAVLGPGGAGQAQFSLPPNTTNLIGLTAHHAAAILDVPGGFVSNTTNPVPLAFTNGAGRSARARSPT
ncbi:MAG: hypothetical protein AAFZ65_21045, partial [Planctomycetota bacterium]